MRQIHEEIIDALSAASGGLSSPALRQRLSRRLSQPTLSRHLSVLRARGLVTVEGPQQQRHQEDDERDEEYEVPPRRDALGSRDAHQPRGVAAGSLGSGIEPGRRDR